MLPGSGAADSSEGSDDLEIISSDDDDESDAAPITATQPITP